MHTPTPPRPEAPGAPFTTPARHRTPLEQPPFLPMTREEMDRLGWDALDILIVSGDGYVDHPSFAAALLGRWLVAHGYRTGVISQPRWDTPQDVQRMGRPALFTAVSAGALDSMLAHYTAFRKKRHDDAYTPGGKAGARPNRAVTVYTSLVRQAFPGMGVVIGGIEASLRRITHYDFWTDKLRRPILQDSKADCLVYGMGERAILALAGGMALSLDDTGTADAAALRRVAFGIPGTAVMGRLPQRADDAESPCRAEGIPDEATVMCLPSHEAMEHTPALLMEATLMLERHVQAAQAWAVQPSGDRAVVLAPPAPPLEEAEMDSLYALPFARRAHPAYTQPIPAEAMIQTSITTHRGCGGGCSFCSLALHQGRRIASRSRDSILSEVRAMSAIPRFSGSISDVGGPSANMWQARCAADPAKCRRTSCMHPGVCPQFKVDQSLAVDMLRRIRDEQHIRHVRVASGVRFDLAMRDDNAMRAYTMEFTGGQLKVAPEHICDTVLHLMRKPGLTVFEAFLRAFERYSEAAGKEQYVVPYLMSGFPGCTDNDMRALGDWLARRGWRPRQVQCFIPTPGTVATAMFFTETAPDGTPLYVARTDAQRLRQHHILMPDAERQNPAEGRPARQEKDRQGRRGQNAARSARSDHSERPERSESSERPERPEKPEKPGRSGHADRSGRPDRDKQPQRPRNNGGAQHSGPEGEKPARSGGKGSSGKGKAGGQGGSHSSQRSGRNSRSGKKR